jgi:hypothetical protein
MTGGLLWNMLFSDRFQQLRTHRCWCNRQRQSKRELIAPAIWPPSHVFHLDSAGGTCMSESIKETCPGNERVLRKTNDNADFFNILATLWARKEVFNGKGAVMLWHGGAQCANCALWLCAQDLDNLMYLSNVVFIHCSVVPCFFARYYVFLET